jgi:hypothetical protein
MSGCILVCLCSVGICGFSFLFCFFFFFFVFFYFFKQVVLVSKETRRPIPIEDKWRNLYGPHCIRGEPLIIKPQAPPESGPLSVYEVNLLGPLSVWGGCWSYGQSGALTWRRLQDGAPPVAVSGLFLLACCWLREVAVPWAPIEAGWLSVLPK